MIAFEGLTRVGGLLTPSVLELFPNFKAQPSLGVHRGNFSCIGLNSQVASVVKEAKLASPECKMDFSQEGAAY